MTPNRPADAIDPAVRALLAALPDPPAPPMPAALRARFAAEAASAPGAGAEVVALRPARAASRRGAALARRRAWLVAAALALAVVGAWRIAPERAEAPSVVVVPEAPPAPPAAAADDAAATLRELDAALTAAYAAGADADEVAALWEARTALASSVPVDAATPRLHPL